MSIEKIKELRELTGAGLMDVKKALEATGDDIKKSIEWLRENGIAKAAKKSGRIAAEGSIFIASNNKKVVIVEINSETDFVASNEKFINLSEKIANTILKSDVKSNDVDEALKLKMDKSTIDEELSQLITTIGEKITLRRFESFELQKGNSFGSYKHSNGRIGAVVIGDNVKEDVLKDISMHITAMNPEYLDISDVPSEVVEKEIEISKKELEDKIKGKKEEVVKKILDGKVVKAISELVLLRQTFVKDQTQKVSNLLGKDGKLLNFVRYEVGEGIEKKVENFAEEVMKQVK